MPLFDSRHRNFADVLRHLIAPLHAGTPGNSVCIGVEIAPGNGPGANHHQGRIVVSALFSQLSNFALGIRKCRRKIRQVRTARITFDPFPQTGAVIKAIGADYAGAAGSNPVVSSFDELWAYTSERGRRLFDEMIPPPTRKIACRLPTTYAGFSGESVLLEELWKRGQALPEIAPNLSRGRWFADSLAS